MIDFPFSWLVGLVGLVGWMMLLVILISIASLFPISLLDYPMEIHSRILSKKGLWIDVSKIKNSFHIIKSNYFFRKNFSNKNQ